MVQRGPLIVALLVVELAIVGETISVLRNARPIPTFAQRIPLSDPSGTHLAEGGPHRVFDAGAHPDLTVDIGYADLTIETSDAPQVDVSLSASSRFGMLRSTAPVTAREDGSTVRIATTEEQGWSMGDDRMVTVVVPAEAHVRVVNAGDITATGLRSEAWFNSIGKGSVTIEDYRAPTLHVASSDGSIHLHEVTAPRLDAASSDGDVDGSALRVQNGSIESDGRVTLGFAPGVDTLVTAKADDGRIRLSGFGARPTAASSTDSDDQDDDSSSQTVRVGGGGGNFDVHSNDGNITLAQE